MDGTTNGWREFQNEWIDDCIQAWRMYLGIVIQYDIWINILRWMDGTTNGWREFHNEWIDDCI